MFASHLDAGAPVKTVKPKKGRFCSCEKVTMTKATYKKDIFGKLLTASESESLSK